MGTNLLQHCLINLDGIPEIPAPLDSFNLFINNSTTLSLTCVNLKLFTQAHSSTSVSGIYSFLKVFTEALIR